MLIPLDLGDALAAAALLDLQRLAYAQEAALIGYPDLPPLHETLSELMECGETIIAWREAGELLGALGYKQSDDSFDICRLIVAPKAQRRGIARALLIELIALGRHITVTTAHRNQPALALYESLGFLQLRPYTTDDGLVLMPLARW